MEKFLNSFLGNLIFNPEKQTCNFEFHHITWVFIAFFNVVLTIIIVACYAQIYLRVKKYYC